ncbi:MAG TPA: LuxR C-terminal-related transcriptional regulator [Acidimicrobiales bacterium]|nr:LuxR C-terminal-related transcriptional regulator [Acidimicrobiales bacterium]
MSSFVGRRRDLTQVVALVSGSPLTTITGHSGMGKTRLAVEVARRLVPAPPDGVWMVDLAHIEPTRDGEAVAEATASVLDIRPQPGQSCAQALIDRLRRAAMLVVVDNCEHLAAAAAAFAGALLSSCPGLSMLATSHGPLGLTGEQVWPLGPLSLPAPGRPGAASDAVALFHARARAIDPGFVVTAEGGAAVADICRRLDGIPLAIELAAARTAVLSPIEIAERLDERFALLADTGRATVARHRTLQAALDWSWDLLAPAEQALLRRLSVFTGSAGLADVEAVCIGGEVDRRAVLDLLSALVSKSLVVADRSQVRTRFRLLETVRAYGRERLEEAAETGVFVELHAHWYMELAEDGWHRLVAEGDQGAADVLEVERDNLRAALVWFLGQGDAGSALRMGSALTPFWKTRAHFREGYREGRELLEQALALGADAPSGMRVRGLWGVGILSLLQGDLDRASSALKESLALARVHRYERPAVEALNLLAFIAVFTDDPLTALPLLEESVGWARDRQDKGALLTALGLYGRAQLFSGDTDAARAAFAECRDLGRSPEVAREGEALVGLVWVALSKGRHDEAARLFAAALPLVRRSGDPFALALLLSFAGELAWRRGEHPGAATALEEGMELARSIGAPFPLSRCLLGLGRLASTAGDQESAVRLVEDAEEGARRAVLPHAVVRCLIQRGELARVVGDLAAAADRLDEALALAAQKADRMGRASALRRLGRLAHDGGDYHGATARYLESLELAAATAAPGAVAATLEGLAGTSAARGRPEWGARLLGAAAALRRSAGAIRSPADALDHDADVALAWAALGPAAFEQAFSDGAALSLEEAVAFATRGRGGRRRPASGWASLTAAESQVVDLVAEGCSNREVAERMFVSPRTVQGHLARVFRKVGVASRRELREAVRRR